MLMSPDSSQKIIRIQVQECTQSQQHHPQPQTMHRQQLPPHLAVQQSAFMAGQVQGQVHKFQIHQPPQPHILKIKSDNVVGPKAMMHPPTPNDYHPKNPPVMDTTVASSGEPDLNIEFDGTTVLCRVCGDKASGFHYGVHSCEGCKGFFRRSIQQKIQYRPCTKNQQCSILRINRNRCQYCRLKKCIAVGMSRDAVRFGRVPKREKARILAAMQQSTQNRGNQRALATELDDQPRLLASVLRAHMETCEFTREKVTQMRQRARDCPSYSMPTLACPLNPAPELQSEQEFSQRFAHVIRGVIDFAGMIPGFQMLTQDDKFTLLKAGLFDALFVRLICMFDSSINSIICLNGQVMRRDSIQNGANARFLVDSTFNFSERMNSMQLTDAEIGLFCAIVLITPDRPGLRNVDLIERMYSKLKACLQSVITQNRPDKPEFMQELLKTLPDLRTLSTLHTEKLVVFRTEHKEMLRQQMWTAEEEAAAAAGKSASWDGSSVEDIAKSPMGSVSSTESGDTYSSSEYGSSMANSAPLLAATLSGGCPMRHRASSGSSAEDDIVGAAHLAQNGLTITPVVRAVPISAHHIRCRKLDSPTDSGIESGNEKHEHKVPSSGSSSCSSPRSSFEDQTEDKRHIEDMPVLKRVLQAPPLYDTNSLMDEAYKPHKKFRAMRHRESESDEPQSSTHQSPSASSSPPQHQSQLHMHLTRPQTNNNNNGHGAASVQQLQQQQQQHHQQQQQQQQQQQVQQHQTTASLLSSTHSVLAKSLMAEPRMTPEQMKRSDIIQNYIMRESQQAAGLFKSQILSSPHHSSSAASSPSISASGQPQGLLVAASPSPVPNAGCPYSNGRWSSVITTTTNRQQTPSPPNNQPDHHRYFQSPHSTSTSPPSASSPSATASSPSPRLLELQVDCIATGNGTTTATPVAVAPATTSGAEAPLNLSKKSPSPPPRKVMLEA